MNKVNFTKKLVVAACLFSMGLSVCAENIYPYENKQTNKTKETTQQTQKGDTIIVNSNKTNNSSSLQENFQSLPVAAQWLIGDSLGLLVNQMPLPSEALAVVNPYIVDPYVIPINGKYYVMVKDKTEGAWGPEDLLGYTDPKNDKFRSLRALESDKKYAKLTGEEIQKAGVRLVQLNKDGVLLVKERNKDYDLDKINYIDMLNLKVTANGESTGIFGHFNVHLKTTKPKMVTGFVTYDTESKLKILFE